MGLRNSDASCETSDVNELGPAVCLYTVAAFTTFSSHFERVLTAVKLFHRGIRKFVRLPPGAVVYPK